KIDRTRLGWPAEEGYRTPCRVDPHCGAPCGGAMVDHDRVPIDDAVKRVRHAIYGDECIGDETERERWLIERYVHGSATRSSIIPARTHYDLGGRIWAEYPGSPNLVA